MTPNCLHKIRKSHEGHGNLLTFDIEDWFHTSALNKYINPESWEILESELRQNVYYILEILDNYQAKATFFVLGWVAERYPEIVWEIGRYGHEIASHGYRHRLIYDLDRDTFREYVKRSKQLLEDLTGKPVLGYRATSFSIVKDTLWALDVLREAGFRYDASMFPVSHDIYGIEGFPRFPFVLGNGLMEIPASTVRLGEKYPHRRGRLFSAISVLADPEGIELINRTGYPAVVYLHPWELDPGCPRVAKADWRTRFRQYVNLDKTKSRLTRLLTDFTFMPIIDYINRGDFFETSHPKL